MFSFNHVAISVNDLDKTLDFYKLFGFEKYKEYGGGEILRFNTSRNTKQIKKANKQLFVHKKGGIAI